MLKSSPFIFAELATLLALAVSLAAQPENTPEFRANLVAMKKYAEAFAAFQEASAKDPKNLVLLYNTGLTAYLSGKAKEAVTYWSKLKGLEPDRWRVRSKLVQAHDAAGQTKERDAERDALFKLRKETKNDELRKLRYYVRDQFSVGDVKLMVFEYFELEGDEPIRFSFDVIEAEGQKVKTRYTLGSYTITNAIAREQKQIKAGQRLFHLDGYKQRGSVHESYNFFVDEPAYDIVKAAVKEILQGKRKPLSRTVRSDP